MARQQAALAPFQRRVQLGLEAHGAQRGRRQFTAQLGQHLATPHAAEHQVLAACGAAAHQPRQHAAGARVDMADALEIEHRKIQAVAGIDHRPQHRLQRGEAQVALQLEHRGAGAVRIEQPAFGRWPPALGAHVGQAVARPHRGGRRPRRRQAVQAQLMADLLAHRHAARAVATRIQQG